MSCHRASTASATMASSPVKPAPRISSVSVSCLPCRSFRSMTSRRQRQDFDERSARGVKSTRASVPLLRQQHAHHRDLPARATAETQAHASSAKDHDRHLMMTKLMLDICKYDQCLCWLPADNVIPCLVTSMLSFGKTQKRNTPKRILQRTSGHAPFRPVAWLM
jgi:hypothetical protein